MAAVPEYQYQRLANVSNTRFIQLCRATHFDDPIHVTIADRAYRASQTHHPISYEALSYAWGSDVEPAYIFVGANSRLRVRRNVVEILKYLRGGLDSGCTVRTLWIDSICINQADNDEKEKQVTMMGEIYAYAARVLIWTGAPGHDLRAFYASFTSKNYSRWTCGEVSELMQFLQTGWFTRRWVVQEIMHAREACIICGSNTMEWSVFRSFTGLLKKGVISRGLTPPVVATLYHLNNLAAAVRDTESTERCPGGSNIIDTEPDDSTHKPESMTTLLTRYAITECADDRDRIYALRSLSSSPITVDYQISATKLYENFSHTEVVRRPMAIMSCAGAFGLSAASWIPDWRMPMRYNPFHSSLNMQCPTLRMEGDLVNVTNASLMIQAGFGGVVDSVADPPGPAFETQSETLYRWGNYFAQRHNTVTSELGPEDGDILFCALSATPIEQCAVEDTPPSSVLQTTRSMWTSTLRSWESYETKFVSKAVLLVAASNMGFAHTKRGRSCFFTSAGQFGLGPDSIQIGDWVVNMLGCDSMIALRPIDTAQNNEKTHGVMRLSQHPAMTVVGDCWIPGLIEPNRRNPAYNLRTFCIV
jgi:hypothetical protein